MLGKGGRSTFYRKFLLKKAAMNGNASQQKHSLPLDLPSDLHVEESILIEPFINYKTSEGRVLESSVEKKGRDKAFTYT